MNTTLANIYMFSTSATMEQLSTVGYTATIDTSPIAASSMSETISENDALQGVVVDGSGFTVVEIRRIWVENGADYHQYMAIEVADGSVYLIPTTEEAYTFALSNTSLLAQGYSDPTS